MPDRVILFGPYRLRFNEDTGEAIIEEYDPSQKKWVTVFDFVNTARTVGKVLSVPVGTNNTWGQTVSYTPRRSLMPYQIYEASGGTFASGETVRVELIVVFDDGSTKTLTIDHTFSGDENYIYPDQLLDFLMKSGPRHDRLIKRIDVHAKSNQATTQATITVEIDGWDV